MPDIIDGDTYTFDIEGVHWTEPGPHLIVKGKVFLSEMSKEQSDMVKAKLHACAVDIAKELGVPVNEHEH